MESSHDDMLAFAEHSLNEMIQHHESDLQHLALEEQLLQRESFFSLVSHDLRGPLTAAKLCAELLIRSPEMPASLIPLTRRIVSSVERANIMIRDFLDAKLLEKGQSIPIHPASCDLDEVVKISMEEFELLHRGRCLYQSRPGLIGQWDRSALRRVLDNLVSNALKYGGKREITISTRDLGDAAEIIVHNWGNPIAPDDLATLFTWNRRTEAALKSGQTGWGLGLVLVKGVAEAHGGSVRVESCAREGTTFRVHLPKGEPAIQ